MLQPLTMTSLGDGIYSDDGDEEFLEENEESGALPIEEESSPLEGDPDFQEEAM